MMSNSTTKKTERTAYETLSSLFTHSVLLMQLCLDRRRERLVEYKAHKPHASLHDRREDDRIAPITPAALILCLLLDLRDELIDCLLDRRDALGEDGTRDTLLDLLRANDMTKVRQIYLLHLSDGNSDAAAFRRQVQQETGAEVYIA